MEERTVNFASIAVILTTKLPLHLSLISHPTWGVVDCGDRVLKSRGDGGEAFGGRQETDTA